MNKIENTIILIFIIFLCSSCKDRLQNNKKLWHEISSKGDTVWLRLPNKVKDKDSIKITAKYSLDFDDIKLSPKGNRLTSLVLTEDYISSSKFKKMVDSFELRKMKNMGMKMVDLRKKDSVDFYFKFKNPKRKYLNGVLFDIIFQPNFNGKGDFREIQHVLYFRWNIDKN